LAPQIAHEKLGKPAVLVLRPSIYNWQAFGPLKTAKNQASSAMLRQLPVCVHNRT
jgi:hypothetical protein